MDRIAVLNFIREHSLAVEASVSTQGRPQAAIVGFVVSDDFEIFFDSVVATRKVGNLRHNPLIAMVIGGHIPGDERSVQFEGIVDEPIGFELRRLKSLYFKRFPDGREREHWPGIAYFRAKPVWIRYSDYNQSPALVEVFHFPGGDLP